MRDFANQHTSVKTAWFVDLIHVNISIPAA